MVCLAISVLGQRSHEAIVLVEDTLVCKRQ